MKNEEILLFHLASHTNQLRQLTELLEGSGPDNELIINLIAGMKELIKSNDETMQKVLGSNNYMEYCIESNHSDDFTIRL